MATIRIEHEITKEQLLELIQETSFSKPEIKQILLSLFPTRQVRIIGEISEIGEIFSIGDIQFICKESLDGSCNGCALTDICNDCPMDIGFCTSLFRSDNKSVIFKHL